MESVMLYSVTKIKQVLNSKVQCLNNMLKILCSLFIRKKDKMYNFIIG